MEAEGFKGPPTRRILESNLVKGSGNLRADLHSIAVFGKLLNAGMAAVAQFEGGSVGPSWPPSAPSSGLAASRFVLRRPPVAPCRSLVQMFLVLRLSVVIVSPSACRVRAVAA